MKAFQKMKRAFLAASVLLAGTVGFASAQDTAQAGVHQTSQQRIAALLERVKSQREQIAQNLVNKTITADQAQDCRVVLNEVEKQYQFEIKANGAAEPMPQESYETYCSFLDVNSSLIQAPKESAGHYASEPRFTQVASLK
jgi:hypothetical protein